MSPPFDERRRLKETVDRSTVGGVHPAAEPEDGGWPPSVHELTRPGIAPDANRSSLPSLEKIGKASSAAHAIWILIAALSGGFATLVIWINTRASSAEVDTKITVVRKDIEAPQADRDKKIEQLTLAVATLTAQLSAFQGETGRRFDALDKILDRQFGQTTMQPSLPAFGPAARSRGKQGP